MTSEELAKHKRELQDELERLGNSHKQEQDEIKEQIKELKEWQTKQLKAEADKDAHHSSKTTMVVPPDDVTPKPAPDNIPTTSATPESKKKGGWRSIW
jgi:seryl-tRNA synthetase